jgi:cation:H+ antiporter
MTFVMLLAGLALLLISGQFLVRGGVCLANHLKISKLVVGLTVVSFGTSAPELVISLDAAALGYPNISVGNVVGSNISNIGLVLALTALITPYFVKTRELLSEWIPMMGATILLVLMLLDFRLSRIEGIILLLLLFVFIYWSIRKSRNRMKEDQVKFPPVKLKLPAAIIIVILSCLGLVAGAEMLVRSASQIARMLGVSERIISVSVIAVGTSLPELATSVIAAARKENDISISNIIGSNIFNILAILGATSAFVPFSVTDLDFSFDMFWMLGISLLLFLLILPLKGSNLRRWKGLILVLAYFTYIYIVFFVK